MESVYAQVGNVTVYTFITPMPRGETNAREIALRQGSRQGLA